VIGFVIGNPAKNSHFQPNPINTDVEMQRRKLFSGSILHESIGTGFQAIDGLKSLGVSSSRQIKQFLYGNHFTAHLGDDGKTMQMLVERRLFQVAVG
jgi:hypothetical protein